MSQMDQAEVDALKAEVTVLKLQVETCEMVNQMQVAYITKLRTVVDEARKATGGYRYPSVMPPGFRPLAQAVVDLDKAQPVRMATLPGGDST